MFTPQISAIFQHYSEAVGYMILCEEIAFCAKWYWIVLEMDSLVL